MKMQTSPFVRPLSLFFFALVLTGAFPTAAQIAMPVVTVRAPDSSAAETGDKGRFILLRDGPTNLALNVNCILGGAASNGVDYVAIPSFIPIPAGVREVPVQVTPVDDSLVEGPETVVLQLASSPLLPPVSYLIGPLSNAVVIIADNDESATNQPPTVQIVSPTNSATFAAPANVWFCADARDADGYVDYVEYFANNIRIGARTNCLLCASIQNPFCFMWTNVPPGAYALRAKATDNKGAMTWSSPVEIHVNPPPLPVVTIVASDPQAAEIPPVPPGLEMPQKIDPGVFLVTRTGGTNLPMTVYYTVSGTASNGVDYGTLPGQVTILAGAHSAAIEVMPIDDSLVEGTESVVVRLAPVACIAIYPPPPECYQVGSPNEAVVFIADNDSPANLPPDARITKPLDGQTFVAPTNVAIRVETKDRDGYVDHVEFYAGTNLIGEQTRYYLTPPPPGQLAVFEMTWTNPPVGRHELRVKARDDDGASGWSQVVTIWVANTNLPPPPPIVTISAPDPVASEGTNCYQIMIYPPPNNPCVSNTATFVIRRAGPTNNALTVNYCISGTASNGVDYLELPGAVTIPAGRRAAEFKVVPIDDNLREGVETVVLRLCVPPTATAAIPPYVIGCPGRAAAIIVDNDEPRPATGPLPDRCFHVVKPGANGSWWRIECSTDMLQWTPMVTIPVIDGAIDFVDPDADELPNRFYRAVPDSPPPSE